MQAVRSATTSSTVRSPDPISRDTMTRVLSVTAALFGLYLLTASYSNPYGTDALTNAAQARAFADDQDPILEELDGLEAPQFRGVVAWFTESPNGTTSQYPPGTAFWTAPFYLVDSSYERITLFDDSSGERVPIELAVPSTYVPAAVAAGLSVALAIGFFGLTLSAYLSRRNTLLAMGVAGLGTSAWSVAADEIWQHGPAMMCISAGNFFASKNRFGASGFAFAAAILIRPHTAVVAAGIGVAVAIRRRSIREILTMGVISGLGLVALIAYNNAVFDSYSISGGYGSVFADRFVNDSPLTMFTRLGASLTHLRVGMLWYSPFLIFVFIAAVVHRRSCPDWSVGAAVGSVIYLLIQFRANRVTGGAGFFSYRYPLEALMAAGPMLAIAASMWLPKGERRRVWFTIAAVFSVAVHGVGAVLF